MFNFGIAHWAMVNEFVDVLGRYIAICRMVIRVLQAGHNKVVFSSGMIRKLAGANPAPRENVYRLS
jgi:hypothetical protein